MDGAARPLVSVIVLTYNHEHYIAHTLDSILAQETDARLEILVMEDCSPDGTRAIVQEYEAKHTGVVKLFAREKNAGGKQNLLDGFKHATGDFIAILDGDDYWSDTQKLALQLTMLNEQPDLIAVGHNTLLHHAQGDKPDYDMVPQGRKRGRYTLRDFIRGKIYMHSSSYLFRHIFKGGLPTPQHDVRVGDTFMAILFATHGDIGFVDRTMSVYRYTKKGVWSALDVLTQRAATLESFIVGNEKLDYRYAADFDWSLVRYSVSFLKEVLIRAPWRLDFLVPFSLLIFAHLPGMFGMQCGFTRRLAQAADQYVLRGSKTPHEPQPVVT